MLKKFLAVLFAVLFVSACSSNSAHKHSSANGGEFTPGTQEDLVSQTGDRVFFAYDSSELTSEAKDTLDRQVKWLEKYSDKNIVIEGHTDERGTREYNLALGERRASAARNYLVSAGIAKARISTVSYGKERPAVIGDSEAEYSQNRRAVTTIN